MSEFYYFTQKLLTEDNLVKLGQVKSDVELEPISLLSGVKLSPNPTRIEIDVPKNTGDFYADVIFFPITLYSNTVKEALESEVDNIEFYPVTMNDQRDVVKNDYWFANICGRIECIDQSVSDYKTTATGRVKLKSFVVDQSKIMGAEIFRLHEMPTLVVVNERIYNILSSLNLQGIVLENTKNYPGYV